MKYPERHRLPEIDTYLELGFDQFKITGRSIAGVETVYSIPQFDLTLDIGRAPHFAFSNNHLALSHWHLDHAGGVAFYLGLRNLNALGAAKIIVPPAKRQQVESYLLELKRVSEVGIRYEVVSADTRIPLKRNLFLEARPAYHSTDTTGYVVIARRHHLKSEFRGKPPEEIIKAKRKGIEVTEEEEEMLLAYSGDSRIGFLDSDVLEARVLLMECSFFFEEADSQKIRDYGHTHIKEWARYADKIVSPTVIMTHTSQRYSVKEIEKQCRKYLPRDLLERLVIFR